MDETFTPTLDWGNELAASALWVTKAWASASVVTLIVLVLLARYTTWGRQFWRITGAYFRGRDAIPVWALMGVLTLLVMIDVRLAVLFRATTSFRRCKLLSPTRGRRNRLGSRASGLRS